MPVRPRAAPGRGGAIRRGLRVDLHVHTTVSDGKPTPEEIVDALQLRGLDGVAVTDHDSFEGGVRAQRYARVVGSEAVVLVGAEVRTEDGDVLVLCGESWPDRIPRSVAELIDVAHEHGCAAVAAHPFDVRRKGVGRKVYRYRWDAIEVFNAMSDPLSNELARRAAEQLGLPGVAGSDAHVLDALGSAYTLVYVDEAEPQEVVEAVRRGDVKPVAGRPSVPALLRTLAWSVERRLGRRDRLRAEKLAALEEELYNTPAWPGDET